MLSFMRGLFMRIVAAELIVLSFDDLHAGFTRTRAVFQLWNPNFKPSRARFDGRPRWAVNGHDSGEKGMLKAC